MKTSLLKRRSLSGVLSVLLLTAGLLAGTAQVSFAAPGQQEYIASPEQQKSITAFGQQERAAALEQQNSAGTQAKTQKAVKTPNHQIEILYTNDVHCGVDDNIGYAGLALYKKQMQAETPYVALVDAGDAIQGAPIGTLSDGGYLVEIMNQVEYDFAVPGNHEFDYGMDRFLELAGKLNCGYYSCNFTDVRTGQTVFSPYQMFEYGETRVALIGVSTPESFTKSTPVYFQDGAGNYIYGFCEDESGNALYERVQQTADAARGAGADYVILVGHLGENGVTDRWSSDSVIGHTSGIDACIDGHSHETVASKLVKNKDGADVLVTQTGTKLQNIGRLTIHTDGSVSAQLISEVTAETAPSAYTVKKNDTLSRIAKRELGSYDRWPEIFEANRAAVKAPNRLLPGTRLIIPGNAFIDEKGRAVDYGTFQVIEGIKAQYQEALKVVLGRTDYQLTTLDLQTGKRAVRSRETNLGDLCADAFKYVMDADVGLMNGGGIRADIAPGNITYQETLAVYPYGNMACVAEVTGQQIKDALEMGARYCPEENGGFLHVSGITYAIDTSVLSSVKLDDKGNFLRVDGAYRVTDIRIGGEPIDLNRIYTVASHNYMLKSGGDGMAMFNNCNITRDETMTDVDLLSAYINEELGGTVGEKYADPAGQKRITVR